MLTKLPDISEFQGPTNIQAMINDGAPGIMIRAGYGTATGIQKDGRFDENWRKAKATGKPIFAYVFAYPARSSGKVHAEGLARIVGKLGALQGIMLDLEDGGAYGRPINASDDAWAAEFVKEAKRLLGPLAISYMNTSTKHRFGKGGWPKLRATNSALMEANYGPNDGRSHGFPAPAPWSAPALHQYTSKGTVGGRYPIDLSEFAGTEDQLRKLVLKGSGPAPKPAPSKPKPAPHPVAGNGTSYVVHKKIRGYAAASNASRRRSSNSTVPPGTYFVYNQASGMVNITRVQGVPGWWINPADNRAAKAPTSAPSGHYSIGRTVSGYYTAADAAERRNRVSFVSPGNYYVFNTYHGMVNVTKRHGVPGTWINPADISRGGTGRTNSDGGSVFRLGHTVKGYTTAVKAASGRGSNSTVPAGTYAVFNRSSGMVNITNVAGKPGWWINPAA